MLKTLRGVAFGVCAAAAASSAAMAQDEVELLRESGAFSVVDVADVLSGE